MIVSNRDDKTEPNEKHNSTEQLSEHKLKPFSTYKGMASKNLSRVTYNFISCYAEVLTLRLWLEAAPPLWQKAKN